MATKKASKLTRSKNSVKNTLQKTAAQLKKDTKKLSKRITPKDRNVQKDVKKLVKAGKETKVQAKTVVKNLDYIQRIIHNISKMGAKKAVALYKQEEKAKQKRVTKPRPQKLVSELASQRSYTVRELSKKRYATLKGYLGDIEKHTDEIDSWKKPGEIWSFSIDGNEAKVPFTSIALGTRKLNQYVNLMQAGSDPRYREKLFDKVEFVKFKGKGTVEEFDTALEYKKERVKKMVESERVTKEAERVVKQKGERKLSKTEITKRLVSQVKSEKKARLAAESRLDALEKQMQELLARIERPKRKRKK
jgi:seryl-tRNA synthetase